VIPLLTREAVRAIDADAVERLGVPSLVLMENAGRGATDALLARFGERLRRVVIVGGPGQNGGDGWVVARHLHNRGLRPLAVLVGAPERLRGDAAVNWNALAPLGVDRSVVALENMDALRSALEGASLVVDALFGTGLDRPLEGAHAEGVRLLNTAPVPRVALDLPSGIDADTGQVLGVAVEAALTTTFAAHKRGLHQHPGAALAGEVVLVSIGVPAPAAVEACLFEPEDVGAAVAPRAPDAHKGSAGRVLVVAGSPGHTGAALLSGLGALRAGAGLVTVATRGAAHQALDAKVVELMTTPLPEDAGAAIESALEAAALAQAAVVGPGIGTDPVGRDLALGLAQRLPVPCVLDADALTAVAGAGLESLRQAAARRVLTPHPGEGARLLGVSTAQVQQDRYGAAAELAKRSGQVVILKGARSIVALPDGQMRVCRRGTPALASAGMGDVLAGVVAAQLAALPAEVAAPVAVCLHALAGEAAARGDRGLLAHEVAHALPLVLARCLASR
jgi:ADP-dependent NAD(P)H-hydrate dehydratase / NAD(P)H-hydrate epimerase